MATRKPSPRNRALRPAAEDLECRQLLSGTVSGTDIDGDTWTLRLLGPGTLNVTKQVDAAGNPSPLNSATQINTITVGGTDPLASRLIGTVHKAANGDGKVFFQTFNELASHSKRMNGGLGLLSINMPGFWLGKTTPAGTTPTTNATPSITINDGVDTLRFGGVDTTVGQTNPPPSTAASDLSSVTLGLPEYGGTRVIIDKSISSTQQVPSATAGGTPTTIQHGVIFAVSGRLSLFQANEIDGDAANPPGQFASTLNTNASGTGGTIIHSGSAGTAPFLNGSPELLGVGVTGQIGNLRIGGNATNLTATTTDTNQLDALITNFSVGGETKNVMVVAPNGMKNVAFGKGMDTVSILTHVINTIEANRGALNSNVFVDQTISRVHFGGDVVNTNVETGVVQNFATILSNVLGLSTTSTTAGTASAPPTPLHARVGGGMTALVAGDVTNSVFTAGVEPGNNGTFGAPNQLILPGGQISAKVEGKIDNAILTPDQPNTAFYANQVHLNHGPVIPPNVPEAPYPGPMLPIHAPGLHHSLHIPQLKGLQTVPTGHDIFTGGVATPRGPRKIKT
jgi:hypothetical protein